MVAPIRSFVLSILLVATFAGCITSPPELADTAPQWAPVTATETALGAVPLDNATSDDWFLLSLDTASEGALAAFSWTVPEGAYVSSHWSDDWKVVVGEFAPIFDNGSTPSEWVLYGFQDSPDGLVPAFTVLSPTYHTNFKLSLIGTPETIAPRSTPFYATMMWDSPYSDHAVEEGDTLYLVLAATAPEPSEVGLAFRLLDKEPDYFEDRPASETETFLADRTTAPLVPERTGNGTGLQVALYSDINLGMFVPVGLLGLEAWTDAVQVHDAFPADVRPHASVRDVTFSAPFDSEAGWVQTFGMYWGDEAAGTWAADVDVRGHQVDAHNMIAQSGTVWPANTAAYLLFGFPLFMAMGDGEGPSDATFSLDYANANRFELLFYEKVDLGASLESLFGKPAAGGALAWNGLLGDVPPQDSRVYSMGDTVQIVDHTGRVLSLPGPN